MRNVFISYCFRRDGESRFAQTWSEVEGPITRDVVQGWRDRIEKKFNEKEEGESEAEVEAVTVSIVFWSVLEG